MADRTRLTKYKPSIERSSSGMTAEIMGPSRVRGCLYLELLSRQILHQSLGTRVHGEAQMRHKVDIALVLLITKSAST